MGAAMSVAIALAKDAAGGAIFDVLGVDIPSSRQTMCNLSRTVPSLFNPVMQALRRQ